MDTVLNNKTNNKRIFDCFLCLLVFGVLIRLAIGVGYYNSNDTTWYQLWAESLPDGLFNVYARAKEIDLDYPPIYLFFLYITGWFFRALGGEYHTYVQMFLMKMWPILGDMACGIALFAVFGKKNRLTGLVAAALWLFNPAALFNSSFWGQTDAIMCVMLLVSFTALDRKRPLLACLLFSLAGLTKFQSLFFVPVFLLELFTRFSLKTFLKGIGVAATTVAAVFTPFMIGAKNIMLFFDVYLAGQGRYPHCTLNAYNLYGLFRLNWVEDANIVFGSVSYHTVSIFILVLLVLGVIALYIFAKRPSVWVIGFLFMNSVFMLTTRMHERYQFVVLIFLLTALLIYRHREFFYLYIGFNLVILANHLIPMFNWNSSNSPFNYYYGELMVFFSLLNIALYIISTYVCIKFLFSKTGKTTELKLDTAKEGTI